MKPKLKQVIAKPNNTSIVIYYSKDGKEMRFPTGISISNKTFKNGKYSDWDYSRNMIKTVASDYESGKQKIEGLVEKGNKILIDLYKLNLTPSAAELEELMLSDERAINASTQSYIGELFELFYIEKREKFNSNGTPDSLKDYTSTKNLLKDYETYTGEKFRIYQFEAKFWRKIMNFMKIPHVDEPLHNKYYVTDGWMLAKTIKKRFDILVSFTENLKSIKLCEQGLVDEIKTFRKKEIKVPRTDKVTLTIDEVIALYDYPFNDTSFEIVRDVFVFLCLTGLRYGDYLNFDAKFIRKSTNSGGQIYERKAIKTRGSSGLNYSIPLCDIALEIIKKYNGKLPKPSHPNIQIKKVLKETELFNEPSHVTNKKTGLEKLRSECISMHKGRDTFITNLVDVTPLNQLMKYTGHSKLSTLQGYIDSAREVDTSPIKIFNRKK